MGENYILVKKGKVSLIRDYVSLDKTLLEIGINVHGDDVMETYETNIHKVGIVAQDQDLPDLKQNRLGIKGDFIVIGLENFLDKDGNIEHTAFRGLSLDEANDAKLSLTLSSMHELGVFQ